MDKDQGNVERKKVMAIKHFLQEGYVQIGKKDNPNIMEYNG